MKKITVILGVILVFTWALVGCSESETPTNDPIQETTQEATETEETTETESVTELAPETYVFEIDGTVIQMHESAAPVLEALGKETSYFEAESCAFQGLDRMYGYGSYEVVTYERDGDEYVLSVVLYDDTVKTQEGLRLFENRDRVLEIYGEPDLGNDRLMVYEDEITVLSIVLDDAGQVISIEYNAVVGE